MPKEVTSDVILRVVNRMTAPQQFQFLTPFDPGNGRTTLDTGSTMGTERGVALRQEINRASMD